MDALLHVVGELYEASFNPEHWDKAVAQLCKLVDAHSAAIFMDDHEDQLRAIVGSHGLPAAVVLAYRFGLSKHDHTFQLQQSAPLGQAKQLIDAREFKTSHPFYYRLLLKPNDIGYLCAMNIYKDDEWHVGLGIHRSFQAQPFSKTDLHVLQQLYPHIKRALRIHKEFHKLRSRQQTLQAALGRLTLGLILLKRDGTLSYCNPVAETLLKQHQGLKLTSQNRLQAHFPQENQKLQAMLSQLARLDRQDISTRNLALGLRHPDREHPINIMLTRLNDPLQAEQADCLALYLSDPDASVNCSTDSLHALYELTPAEAGVAIALTNGQSPAQISAANGVSIETVRTQLKNIYTKMGVNKQQDVIRLLLAGNPQLQ